MARPRLLKFAIGYVVRHGLLLSEKLNPLFTGRKCIFGSQYGMVKLIGCGRILLAFFIDNHESEL